MKTFPEKSIGLCLSGGGFRASLYHLGVLRYLAETGQLGNVGAISSVSGGSIIAAYLALRWDVLRENDFSLDSFMDEVYNPFIEWVTSANFRNRWLVLCLLTTPLLLWPNFTWSILWSKLFDRWFYGNKQLTTHDLPDDLDMVFNTTNLASAQGFRIARGYFGDDKGYFTAPADRTRAVRVADAVTASAAHLPLAINFANDTSLWFMDGGVYDNTGLDWYLNANQRPRPDGLKQPEFLVVSDASPELLEWNWAGRRFVPVYRMVGILGRISDILQEQTRRTRKDRFIERIRGGLSVGIMISIDVVASHLRELQRSDAKDELEAIALPEAVVERVRATRTDLNHFLDSEATLLAYHGYSLAHVYLTMFHQGVRIGDRLPYVDGAPAWKLDLSPAAVARYMDQLANSHRFLDRRRRWF